MSCKYSTNSDHNLKKVCKREGCEKLGRNKGHCKYCGNSMKRSLCESHYSHPQGGGNRKIQQPKKNRLFAGSPYCFYCKKQVYKQVNKKEPKHNDATIDHKIPASNGGTANEDNLVVACRECNERKDNTVL